MLWWPWVKPRRLRHHATLAPAGRFAELVSVSVGPRGEAVAVWTDEQTVRLFDRQVTFAEQDVPAPMAGAATITNYGQTRVIEFSGFAGEQPDAQPLPGGRVLLVEPWAMWRPEGPDHNASICGADGELELTACVGDGIEQVRTTRSGAVWVGYSDQGIYGNNNWGNLVRLDLWALPDSSGFHLT